MKIFKQHKNGLLYISKNGEYKFFNIKTGIMGVAYTDIKKARLSYKLACRKMRNII